MVRRVVAMGLGVFVTGASVENVTVAQPRPHAAQPAVVLRVVQADLAQARARLEAHQSAIARCLADAHARDPRPLATLRALDASIALDRRGAAVTVELAPAVLSRGLSGCLAETLFEWSQGGAVGPAGAVVLRITTR